MNTQDPGTINMILDTSNPQWITLTNQDQPSGLPLVSVLLTNNITVHIDPSRSAPEQITLPYPTDNTWEILDALLEESSTTAIRVMIASLTTDDHDQPTKHADPVRVQVTLGTLWTKVLELGQLLWDLHWNPLAHDKSPLALDLVRAQHETRGLTQNEPNPAFITAAVPAAHHFRAEQIRHRLDTETEDLLNRALNAAPELTWAGTNHIRELNPPLTPEQIAVTLSPVLTKEDTILTGTPDWRLSGLGPVNTAPNAIQITPHRAVDKAITITVPAKPGTHPEKTPTYTCFITRNDGTLTATTTLTYNPTTNHYEGHTYSRTELSATDTIHVRPTTNTNPPQPHLHNQLDLQQRTAAYLAHHTTHSPLTRAHLTNISGTAGEEFEWFLFELTTTGQLHTGTTRGGHEVTTRGGHEVISSDGIAETTFKSAALAETEITAISADNGTTLRITLRRYPIPGQEIALELTFAHPDGTTSIHTTVPQTSRTRGIPLKYLLTNLQPNLRIKSVTLRVHR